MFKDAIDVTTHAKILLTGPSGSGKTYGALVMATGMGSLIGLIDSENKSGAKYRKLFKFKHCALPDKSLKSYLDAINYGIDNNFDVLIIDSMSHFWDWLNDHNEKLATAKYKGNTWRAWGESTPMYRQLIDLIVESDIHIIATSRVKSEWIVEGNKPSKIGTKLNQKEGLEYEFDTHFEVNMDHSCSCPKDRTGLYQDKFFTISPEMGDSFAQWSGSTSEELEIRKAEELEKQRLESLEAFTPWCEKMEALVGEAGWAMLRKDMPDLEKFTKAEMSAFKKDVLKYCDDNNIEVPK